MNIEIVAVISLSAIFSLIQYICGGTNIKTIVAVKPA